MRNWQLIKNSITSCKGLNATEKMLKIFETWEKETVGMTHEQKLKHLDRRCE